MSKWELFIEEEFFRLVEEYFIFREEGKFFEISDWRYPQ
jgi:hypothetical protein